MLYLNFGGRASTVLPVEAVDALPLFDGILYLVPVADCTRMGRMVMGRITGRLYRTTVRAGICLPGSLGRIGVSDAPVYWICCHMYCTHYRTITSHSFQIPWIWTVRTKRSSCWGSIQCAF